MAELHLDVISTASSKGLDQAAKDLKETRAEADKLGKSFGALGDDAFDLEKAIEHQRLEVKKLADEFKRTGDRSLFFDMRKERSLLRDLESMAKEVADVAGTAGKAAGQAFDGGFNMALGGQGRTVLYGILIGAAVAAAPAAGAIIGGAVAGAIGTVGVAGGIAMAARDERVKTAFRNFMEDVADEFFRGGSAFADPIINSLAILRNSFAGLGIGETFAQMAPHVEKIAHGLANLFENVMPGLNVAFGRMEPFADAAAEGFAELGTAIGIFAQDVTDSESEVQGLEALFNLLNNTIIYTGRGIRWLSDRFQEFNEGVHGVVHALLQWPAALGGPTGEFRDALERLDQGLHDLTERNTDYTGSAQAAADATRLAAKSGGELYQEALDAAGAIKKLNDQLYEMTGFQLDAEAAADRLAGKVIQLTDSVAEHGTELDANTEQGLRNREMLRGLVEGLRAQYEADLNAGMSAEDAKRKYEDQAVALQNLAIDLGFARDGVANLIGQYKQIPPVITTEFRQIFYQIGGGNAPGEHSGVRIAEYGGARAAGGPVQPGMAYTVGEQGPETLVMGSQGGYVVPNGAGSGGRLQRVAQPFVYGGSNQFEAYLIEQIRTAVQARGGELVVLGLRAPR